MKKIINNFFHIANLCKDTNLRDVQKDAGVVKCMYNKIGPAHECAGLFEGNAKGLRKGDRGYKIKRNKIFNQFELYTNCGRNAGHCTDIDGWQEIYCKGVASGN